MLTLSNWFRNSASHSRPRRAKNWDEFLIKAQKVSDLDKQIKNGTVANEIISRSTFSSKYVASVILDEKTGDYLFELIDGTFIPIDLAKASENLPIAED